MKNFKSYLKEAKRQTDTEAAQEEGFTDAQESLAQKNVFFDFDIRQGFNVSGRVKNLLENNPVGVMDWKERASRSDYAYLGEISSFDESSLSGVRLKKGEIVFRYSTETTAVTGMVPFIKINVLKGLAYFLTQESSSGDTDEIRFESRSVKLSFLRLDPKYMKKLNII
jgi:hypothetical protein